MEEEFSNLLGNNADKICPRCLNTGQFWNGEEYEDCDCIDLQMLYDQISIEEIDMEESWDPDLDEYYRTEGDDEVDRN